MTSTAHLDFTDGDTFKRVTVTDPDVTSSSNPVVSVRKYPPADTDDPGWTYVANTVDVRPGQFTVQVTAFSADTPAGDGEAPNETVLLVYTL